MRVGLYNIKGKRITFNVHRLVAKAFLPNPKNLPQVNHRDENKLNNRVDNLEYCSAQYNIEYSQAKEVAKLDLKTGEVIEVFKSSREAERQTGICGANIANCCNGRIMSAGGFAWAFTGKGCKRSQTGKKQKYNVEVFNRDTGEVIRTFESMRKTAEYLGVSVTAVRLCCNGRQKTVKGYGCRFKD